METYVIFEKDRIQVLIELAVRAKKNLDVEIACIDATISNDKRSLKLYEKKSWWRKLWDGPPIEDDIFYNELTASRFAERYDEIGDIIAAATHASQMRIAISDMSFITRWAK